MIWRDTWRGKPEVVIIAPDDVQGGVIRAAIVLLDAPRRDPHLTVSDGLGRRYNVALPRHLLSETEQYSVETHCTLRAQRKP
ncbi:hypothetical protein GCM10022631_01710 [Deinococcus rubellus]|uniref:Type II toxin-antitoxin system PemK/MazF family toxin n=1 Tax=Deinococcus rubellus TaxID=1889240 RepID=A0ABY5YKX3_9DEIO|nr:hypothetical protein [Deinococcus rubellus]UWX64752.1 hypothetical protein N0D28_03575 [Deinococcus rubellus]